MLSKSPEVAPADPRKPLFGSCWGCRILSGLGLIGSGIWVYLGPRKVMQQKIPPNMWHITQMTFALGRCGSMVGRVPLAVWNLHFPSPTT